MLHEQQRQRGSRTHLHPRHCQALIFEAPVASASVSRAQRRVTEPAKGAQAVVDGDDDDVGLLDDAGALVHGVSAPCERDGGGGV